MSSRVANPGHMLGSVLIHILGERRGDFGLSSLDRGVFPRTRREKQQRGKRESDQRHLSQPQRQPL